MTTVTESRIARDPSTDRVQLGRERGKMSREELQEITEATAQQLLGVSAEAAYAMLDRGELEGSLAEGTLVSLRWLLAS